MSEKNMDSKNRWRNVTIAFRMSPEENEELDLSKWENEPFKPVIKDGKYYGRGAQDDKGPTLAAIYALKTLLDCGFKLKYRVRFIFGTDEENLWRDMPKYVEKEEIPTVGFTPDSKFPLIYSEK